MDALAAALANPLSIGTQSLHLLTRVLDEVIFESCFEAHVEAQTHPLASQVVASAHSHCDIYGNAAWRLPVAGAAGASGAAQDPATFPCARCQRMVTISKYAPHLEKCMGKNSRTSSRVQLRKGPEAQPSISYAAIDDKKKRKRAATEMDQADPLNGSAGFGDVQQYHSAAAPAQSVEQSSAAPAFDENSLITDAASLLDPDFIAQLGAELGFTDGFVNASQSLVPALDVSEHQPKLVLAPVKSDSEGAKRRRQRQLQLDAALARFQAATPSALQSELNENKTASGKGAGDVNAALERRRRDGESSDASSDGERDTAKFREESEE